MHGKRKKLSFAVTPDVNALLDGARKELFVGKPRSEVVRELVRAGIRGSQQVCGAKRADRDSALRG